MIDPHVRELLYEAGYVVVATNSSDGTNSTVVRPIEDCVSTNAGPLLIDRAPAATNRADDWPQLEEEEREVLPKVLELAKEREKKKRQVKQRKQRRGRGHDPRSQVVCRAKGGGRGRGRR